MTEEERIVAAGEYVLGTLAPAERAAFSASIVADRVSADAVRFWERGLASLTGTVADLAPPARVWTAISARIGTRPVANDRGGAQWRTAALALAGVAAALVAVMVVGPRRAVGPGPAPPPSIAVAPTPAMHGQYIAALNAKGRESALLLTLDPVTGAVVAHPVKLSAPAQRNLELWWIAAGAAPRAVGLLDPAQPLRGQVKVDAKLDGGAFAISVEPIGGSTTGAPTGPVVYSGAVVRTAS